MKQSIGILKRSWLNYATALFFLFVAGFSFGQTVPPPEIKQARALIEGDQPKKAVDLLKKATGTYPTDATVWYALGEAQIAAGQRQDAEISFQTGVEKNDKEGLNYAGKGHLRITENQAAEAKKAFDQALLLTKSKNAAVLNAVAKAQLTDPKSVADAMANLQKSKSLDKSNPETALLMGDAFLAQNNGGQAVSSYENAASLDPKWGTPYYKIGLVYQRSKNNTAAEEAFLKAIQIDPNSTLAYKEVGELYYQMGKADLAVTNYAKFLQLSERAEQFMPRQGFFLFMAKKYPEANEIFKKQLEKPDASLLTLRFAAYSYAQAGNLEESRKIFERYFAKAKPEELDAEDYIRYAELLTQLKQDSLAIESYRKSLTIDSTQIKIYQKVAEMLFAKKRYAESVPAFEKLISKRPNATATPQDLYYLGRGYYFINQFEKGITTFDKLIALKPDMTVGYLWLARCKANLDPESTQGLAKADYEKVIEKANPEKGKPDLIEAYSYMGYLYYVKGTAASSISDLETSISWWEKVLTLEPGNVKATEAIKAIKETIRIMKNPPQPKKTNNK